MWYHLFAVATAVLLLDACGATPVKPTVQEELDKLDAVYGEAVVICSSGCAESQRLCQKPSDLPRSAQRRVCTMLQTSDEVTVNVTSSFWGGVSKQTLVIPSSEQVRKGDIIKFRPRDNLFGFIKVAARAGDPNCKWESGLIKGATAQGVVCEGYDYRTVLEILAK